MSLQMKSIAELLIICVIPRIKHYSIINKFHWNTVLVLFVLIYDIPMCLWVLVMGVVPLRYHFIVCVSHSNGCCPFAILFQRVWVVAMVVVAAINLNRTGSVIPLSRLPCICVCTIPSPAIMFQFGECTSYANGRCVFTVSKSLWE